MNGMEKGTGVVADYSFIRALEEGNVVINVNLKQVLKLGEVLLESVIGPVGWVSQCSEKAWLDGVHHG